MNKQKILSHKYTYGNTIFCMCLKQRYKVYSYKKTDKKHYLCILTPCKKPCEKKLSY